MRVRSTSKQRNEITQRKNPTTSGFHHAPDKVLSGKIGTERVRAASQSPAPSKLPRSHSSPPKPVEPKSVTFSLSNPRKPQRSSKSPTLDRRTSTVRLACSQGATVPFGEPAEPLRAVPPRREKKHVRQEASQIGPLTLKKLKKGIGRSFSVSPRKTGPQEVPVPVPKRPERPQSAEPTRDTASSVSPTNSPRGRKPSRDKPLINPVFATRRSVTINPELALPDFPSAAEIGLLADVTLARLTVTEQDGTIEKLRRMNDRLTEAVEQRDEELKKKDEQIRQLTADNEVLRKALRKANHQ